MTDTLITRLRLIKGVCDEAADRIEALQSRLAALEKQEPVEKIEERSADYWASGR